jgi:hypothetical protein
MTTKKTDWRQRWNPRAYWKDTRDFLAYRDELVSKTLQVVAHWKQQRTKVGKSNKNLAFLCSRLELLVEECGATSLLPEPFGSNLEDLAHDLADFLSVLPETDCWERHPGYATPGEEVPDVCEGCPLVGPVKGMSGDHKYYGCDVLAFMGEKLIEWRAGLPTNPWPEPGVWYSAFETDRSKH